MTACYAVAMSRRRDMAVPGHGLPYGLRDQSKTSRRALVTGRTSFRTDGSGPLPEPSVAFPVTSIRGEATR